MRKKIYVKTAFINRVFRVYPLGYKSDIFPVDTNTAVKALAKVGIMIELKKEELDK